MNSPAPQTIYLGSKSPRRRELLKQIGVHFELLMTRDNPPDRVDVDESPLPGEVPQQYVVRIVALKAAAAEAVMRSRHLPTRPVLTADTTVTLNGEILGKPLNADDAARMLRLLSGHTHQVLTAVAVSFEHKLHQALSTSYVTFAPLDDAMIRRYIDSGEPMDKAGAYAIQGQAAKFITKLSGSYTGVMGLPLFETTQLLREVGLRNL
ncbi:MAG: septum formation inhibitor Maf [Betaproteobacteria bacterium]|nr:septum formation inhibitor Maf [Betaproteobacteria bacterium]